MFRSTSTHGNEGGESTRWKCDLFWVWIFGGSSKKTWKFRTKTPKEGLEKASCWLVLVSITDGTEMNMRIMAAEWRSC